MQRRFAMNLSVVNLHSGGPRHCEHLSCDLYSDCFVRVEVLSLSLSERNKHRYRLHLLDILGHYVAYYQHNIPHFNCFQIINNFPNIQMKNFATSYSTTTGTDSLPPEERGLITASSLSINFEFLSNRKIFL